MGKEDLCGEDEHEPVPRCGGPLEVGEVAAGVFEHWAFVDHRQLQMGVGVVDRLTSRFGDDDERERDGSERQSRCPPHMGARGPGDDAAQVSRSADKRADGERQHECRLDEHRQRQVAARAHQREAVRDIPRAGCGRETREREQSEEHERVVAEPQRRRDLGDWDDEDAADECGGRDRRHEPVDLTCSFRVDCALAPEPAQLAIGLQRCRAAPSLQACLPMLDEPREQRGERDATDDLYGGRHGGSRAHPINPRRTAASSTMTSAMRYTT